MAEQHRIRQSFDRSSRDYDAHAEQQRSVLRMLLMQLREQCPDAPARLLDGGCGTGYLQSCIAEQSFNWDVVGLDLAHGMCREAARAGMVPVTAQLEHIPFADASFDMVFSSLAIQWVKDWPRFFEEAQRVLRPGGKLAVSTYLAGTLREMQDAFAQIDGYSHTLEFRTPENLRDAAVQNRFKILSQRFEERERSYATLGDLYTLLRGIGASNKSGHTSRGMMTPRQLKQMESYYLAHFSNPKGVHAHWSLGYLVAQKA